MYHEDKEEALLSSQRLGWASGLVCETGPNLGLLGKCRTPGHSKVLVQPPLWFF